MEIAPAGRVLHRIHPAGRGPLFFGPAPGELPRYRFDDPGGRYGVCYAGTSLEAAFAEVFLRGPRVTLIAAGELAVRARSEIRLLEELHLVQLHGSGLAKLGATAAITSGSYSASREWSRALHAHDGAPDGIAYRPRHDNSVVALALFERARPSLAVESTVGLLEDHDLLRGLLKRCDLGFSP